MLNRQRSRRSTVGRLNTSAAAIASLPPAPPSPPSQADALKLLGESPLSLVLKTPADGCRTMVYALLAPGLPSGSYLSDCEITDVAPAANVSHYNPWVMLVHTAVLEYHLNTTMHDKGPPVVTARVQDSRYVKFSTVLFQEK